MIRTWPIRRWLVVALVSLFLVPAAVTIAIVAIQSGFEHATYNPTRDTARYLETNTDQWQSPTWWQELDDRLQADEVRVELYINGELIHTNAESLVGEDPHRIEVFSFGDQDQVYSATISVPDRDGPPEGVNPLLLLGMILLSILLVLITIAVLLRHQVIKPLESIGQAAVSLSAKEPDITLELTPVREVAQVNAAVESLHSSLQQIEADRRMVEEQRKQFIGAIAHDLRTPLFALRGSLDALTQDFAQSPEKQAHYLEIARSRADRLEHLIADLFVYTRTEYLNERPSLEITDIDKFLASIVRDAQPAAINAGVCLELKTEQTSEVPLDSHLVSRAIENLMENAFRHTPEGGEVTVLASQDTESLLIKVTDTGPGFTPEDLERAFEPMYRGDTARSTLGAGLGMAIARGIVQAHGGTLIARNGTAGGAELTIRLPVYP